MNRARTRVLVVVGAWLVLMGALWASDSQPAIIAFAGIVAAFAAVVFAGVDVGSGLKRVEWTASDQRRRTSAEHDPRVNRLRYGVQAAWLTGSTEISDTLVELVDDRLRAHHHIDRATDPQAADRLLTPTLRRLLSGPRRQTATPRELERILTDIEAL